MYATYLLMAVVSLCMVYERPPTTTTTTHTHHTPIRRDKKLVASYKRRVMFVFQCQNVKQSQ